MITIRKNWKNIGSIHSVIPSPDIKQLQIITLGKKHQYSKKNPHVSSSSSLNTETSKMHQFKSQPQLPSKDKESNHSYQDVASSWVPTEVDYTAPIDDKPEKYQLKLMGNAQKIRY